MSSRTWLNRALSFAENFVISGLSAGILAMCLFFNTHVATALGSCTADVDVKVHAGETLLLSHDLKGARDIADEARQDAPHCGSVAVLSSAVAAARLQMLPIKGRVDERRSLQLECYRGARLARRLGSSDIRIDSLLNVCRLHVDTEAALAGP